MKKKTLLWITCLILIFGFTLSACGSEEPEPEPTAVTVEEAAEEESSVAEDAAAEAVQVQPTEAPTEEPTEVPTEEPTEVPTEVPTEEPTEVPTEEPTEVPAEEPAEDLAQAKTLAVSDVQSLDEFNSYRMILDMNITTTDDTGAETVQFVQMDMGFSQDPEIMILNMTVEGIEGMDDFGEIGMAQFEGTTYMSIPGLGCITTEEGDAFGNDNPFAEMTDPGTFTEDIGDAQLVGEEVINDIEVLHYTFDETSVEDEDAEIEWAEGHVYIAKDEGYLVRFVMDGEGEFDQVAGEGQFGVIHMQMDLVDINQPIETAIPAGCEETDAAAAEWPVPEDAFEMSSFAGFLTYKTNMSMEDLMAFYADALTAEGWTENADNSFVVGDTAIIAYDMDGVTLTVSIVKEDESSDVLTVVIISE